MKRKKRKRGKKSQRNKVHWIKNWPVEERPRELLLEKGSEHVSDAGLIAVLLRSGTKGKDAVALGRELIQYFGSLRGLLSAKVSDLKKVKGLGPAKIAQLIAAIEITRRQLKEQVIGKDCVENDQDVIDYISISMRDKKEEFFNVIFLNRANRILGIDELNQGTIDEASIYPREVIKKAFDIGASSVIFVHNHPSGSLKPSQRDIEVTKNLIAACKAVGITPLDHIIISPYGHISLKNTGIFK